MHACGSTCLFRVFTADMNSENFYKPELPVEIFDWYEILRATFVNKTKPHATRNIFTSMPKIKAQLVVNLYFIQSQFKIQQFIERIFKFTSELHGQIVTVELQNLIEFLDNLWLRLPGNKEAIKVNLNLKLSLIVTNYDPILSRVGHFTLTLKITLSYSSWRSFTIVYDTKHNFTRVCMLSILRSRPEYCENCTSLRFQVILNMKYPNIEWFIIEGYSNIMPQIREYGKHINVFLHWLRAERSWDNHRLLCNLEDYFYLNFVYDYPYLSAVQNYMISEICERINNTVRKVDNKFLNGLFLISPPIATHDFHFDGHFMDIDTKEYSSAKGVKFEKYWAMTCYRQDIMSFYMFLIVFITVSG